MKTLRDYIALIEASEFSTLFAPNNQQKPEFKKLPGTLDQSKPELQYAFPGSTRGQGIMPAPGTKRADPPVSGITNVPPATKQIAPGGNVPNRPGLAPGGNPSVWDWQNEMKKKGAPITVDGLYGPQTEKFGKQYGIPAPKDAQKLPPVVTPTPQAKAPQQPPAAAPETPTDGGLRTQVTPVVPGSQEELDFYKKRGLTPPTEPGGIPGRIGDQPQQPATPSLAAPNDAMTFDQAFGDARRKGETTFTWRGKTYSTDLAKPKVAPAPTLPGKSFDSFTVPRSKRSDTGITDVPKYNKSMYEAADDQLLNQMLTIAKLR